MRVLITGATGLVGREITSLCHQRGLGVNYLTTGKDEIEQRGDYRGFYWNPAIGEIDTACLEKVGAIINLAGENVFQRWNSTSKKKILSSRVNAADLLYKTLQENEHVVGQVVAASAIGVYPSSYKKMYFEDEKAVDDSFLGKVVVEWESANDQFQELGLRVAKIRIGLVLAADQGALPQMQQPFKYNAGAALGNGQQWQSWIHIYDLARIFLHTMEHGLTGTYNGVAPNPLRNKDMMREVAKSMGKSIWLPNVPAFVLKLMLGEMASMVLSSQLAASKKIEESGFSFRFIRLGNALEDLKQKKTGQ